MRFLFIKILCMAAVIVAMCLPFFPGKFSFSLASANYPKKDRWRNILFVGETVVLGSVVLCVASLIKQFFGWLFSREFVLKLVDSIPDNVNYILDVITILISNIAICVIFLIAKKFFRAFLDKKVFTQQSTVSKNKKTSPPEKESKTQDRSEKRLRSLRNKSVLVFKSHQDSSDESVSVSDYDFDSINQPEENDEKIDIFNLENEPRSFSEWVRFLAQKFIGLFYIEKEKYQFVKTGTYRWAKELKIFVILVSAVYLLVCLLIQLPIYFSFEKISKFYTVALWLVNNSYMYPMLSLVFLYELLWFLDGEHKEPEKAEEANLSVSGRDAVCAVSDYEEAKAALLEKYSAKYNIKNFDSSAMSGKSAYNLAEKSLAIQNIAKTVRSNKGFVNGDYMQSIEYMLDGKHVLFDSSLYSALGEYMIHYLFVTLSFGKRALFICKDKKEIENAISFLDTKFKQITKTPHVFWRLCDFDKLHEGKNPDILFLLPEQFLDKSLFTDGKGFFDELVDVFVLDADKILSANNYYCLIMAKKLAKATSGSSESLLRKSGKNIRYSFFSNGHIQAIGNSLRQFFNLEDDPLEAFHSFGLASKTEVFVWHTGMSSTLYVDNGANQVALEVQIAKDISNFGINNINLISDTAVYSSQLNEIQGLTLNKCDISDNPVGYVIVADDYFNLPNSIYNYSRFSGRKSSVLHVVSKPYLLRDYFTSKAEDYVSHFELIGQTMSEHAEPSRANIIILLCDAVNGIERSEFISRANKLLNKNPSNTANACDCADRLNFHECIRMCYKAAFNTDDDYEPRYSLKKEHTSEHEFKTFVYIKDSEKMFERLLETTRTVKIEYVNTQSVENTSVFKDEIVQHFIPGQVIARNNHSYTIKDISVDKGIITLDDTGPSINVPSDYIQTRLYHINSAALINELGHNYRTKNSIVEHLNMSVYDAEISVDTVGYYSIEEAVQTVDLAKPNFAKYIPLDSNSALLDKIRREIKTKMLVVELEMNEESTPQTTYMLSVILHEFMKNVFPHQYRCISVCPIFEEGFDEDKFYANDTAIRDLYPRIINGFFNEKAVSENDSASEAGSDAETVPSENSQKHKLRFAIIEDINGGNGVVETLVDGNGIMITNLLHVVSDFLEWLKTPDGQHCSYLNFGYDNQPSVFDSDSLEKIIRQFRHEIERSELVRLHDKNTCFFCRCTLDSEKAIQLEDGRSICEKCVESSVSTFEDLDTCLADVSASIKSQTSVPDTFPTNISVDFVSTEDLKTRYPDSKTVPLGYCNHVTNCIYVEYGLPRAAVYSVLVDSITEIWQDSNVINNGNDLLAVQSVLVEIQTLYNLKKVTEAKCLETLHESNETLNELKKLLDEAGSQDSFAYFLGTAGKQTSKTEDPHIDDDDDISFIAERDPSAMPRFYFNILNDDEKAVYNQIYNALMSCAESTGAPARDISDDKCQDVLSMVLMDNPNIFWCCNPPAAISVDSSGMVKNIIFKYCMSPSEIKRRNKKIEKAVKPFIKGIKESMGDYEVALRAHENIINLIDYDSIGLDIQEKDADRYNKPDNLRSVYGVFVEEKAICAGYAKAYQYLLNRLGIECAYLKGPCLDGGLHAWNLVKLEGDYYYVDVTFDDRSNTESRKNSNAGVSYDYFCITSAELAKSRNISKPELYPECVATKCNYFVRSKRFFKNYDAQQIGKLIVSAMKSGETEISFKAENERVLKTITNRLIESKGIYDLIRSIDNNYTLNSYSYSINKELNIIHLFIDKFNQ